MSPGMMLKSCVRSEEHTSELQSHLNIVCRLLLEKNQAVPGIRGDVQCDDPGIADGVSDADAYGGGQPPETPFFFNDTATTEIYTLPYTTLFRSQKIVFHQSKSPLRQGSYRGLAATANHFARETHLDELARAVKMDPLEFRLKNLKDDRQSAVLAAAGRAFGWGKTKSSGSGYGIA